MKARFIIKTKRGEIRTSVELDGSRTVLDTMELIRSDSEPGLSYRHSCHHGSCGTCGALVNGKPVLMCLTKVDSLGEAEILVEPLSKMLILDGIAVHPGPLFEGLPETDYLRYGEPSDPTMPEAKSSILEKCIECGICVEACPVQKPFIGPASLASIETELQKHPSRLTEMLEVAGSADGATACERAFECSRSCPQGVAPGRKITELLKRLQWADPSL